MTCKASVSIPCHPEQAFFAQRKPALSEAEGDLGEPRGVSRPLRHNNRALGASLFLIRRVQLLLVHLQRQLPYRLGNFLVRRYIF